MSQKRQNWTNEEDQTMINLIKKYGSKKWALISQKMRQRFPFEGRTGKQCRQRWHNHLCPKINKEPWTQQEIKLIFDLHKQYGNKWTQIAKLLQGRTDNAVKNQYYSSLRKGLRRMCKIVGTQNSTSKIKKIKPNILSKFITNFTQLSFMEEQGESEFYDMLFQLSDQSKYQQMKQNYVSKEMKEKIQYILQKILDSKNFHKLAKQDEPKMDKTHKKKKIQKNTKKNKFILDKAQQQNEKTLQQSNKQFQFHNDSEDLGSQCLKQQNIYENQNKKELNETQNNNYHNKNQYGIDNSMDFNSEESVLQQIKNSDNLVNLQPDQYQFEILQNDIDDLENNQNFCKSFFGKSPCFTDGSYFQARNSCIFQNLNKINYQDTEKTYNDIIKDIQNKSR